MHDNDEGGVSGDIVLRTETQTAHEQQRVLAPSFS